MRHARRTQLGEIEFCLVLAVTNDIAVAGPCPDSYDDPMISKAVNTQH